MTEWKARRFWDQAAIGAVEGGFGVLLDGRPVRTPGKALLALPTEPLAAAVAAEWADQGEIIQPHRMPFTRAANSAIEKVAPQPQAVADALADYADSDVTCYRAERPAELVAWQDAAWDPLLDWCDATYGARLIPVQGVMHRPQSPAALARLRQAVRGHGPFELTALSDLVGLSGSLVIGLAAAETAQPVDSLWTASRIDEIWQAEQWGEDAAATQAAAEKARAFVSAWRFFRLTRNMPVD